MKTAIDSNAWRSLMEYRERTASTTIADLFTKDANRFHDFSFEHQDLLLDISKNRISFNVYKLYSYSPLFKINKEIKNKKSGDVYSVLNSQGYIISKSQSLESLINLVNWKKFKLVK